MAKGSMACGPSMDYQAEDDHRTMQRAGEIQQDPKRLAGVAKHHKKVTKANAFITNQLTGANKGMTGGRR